MDTHSHLSYSCISFQPALALTLPMYEGTPVPISFVLGVTSFSGLGSFYSAINRALPAKVVLRRPCQPPAF